MKINKLYIKNFKVFEEVTIDFTNKNLTILDGPNGFGKTTIYDAIELLITGQIRRYNDLASKTLKGSQVFHEMPFYHSNGDGTPIVIKAEIETNNTIDKKTLIRKTGDKTSLFALRAKHDFSVFVLYEAENFESKETEYNEVADQDVFIKNIFGENYRENFEFLNYVEQEESYYMLKHKDKDRKNNIQHLFNTEKFSNQLDKIKAIRQQIHKLVKPLSDLIKDLEEKINLIKDKLSENQEVSFMKIFGNKDELWDKEEIDFKLVNYTDVLGDNGIITKLENLVLNRDTFKIYRKNRDIRNIIDGRKESLTNILKFDNFIGKRDVVLREKALLNSLNNFLENSKTVDSVSITDGLLDIDSYIYEAFANDDVLINYNKKIISIRDIVINSNKISKLYSDMSGTRDNLIKYFELYREEKNEESEECPLCGYNWGTQQELLIQIGTQTYKLGKLADKMTKGLSESIDDFKENEHRELYELLDKYKRDSFYNEKYFNEYVDINEDKLKSAKKYLEDNSIEFLDLLNKDTNPETEIKVVELLSRLSAKIVDIDNEKIKDDFNDLFSIYFTDSMEFLFDFDFKDFDDKRKYFNWQYSQFQNTLITEYNKDKDFKQKRLELIIAKEDKLTKLERIYEKSLTKYSDDLIKDIELLFHLYTGRILQDYQGGLGLFIKDLDGLRFVTEPTKTYDALFSMSAGQLSALIISFTLALNKKYSKNKLLFIDDPVQTMDEININGFIELLRNEFYDRQIFISTHESMMSTYMRYKFEKYNLNTKSINVKEITNQTN